MMQAPPSRDSAGVVIPPPLFFAAGLGLAYLLHRRWPIHLASGWAPRLRISGLAIAVIGLGLMAAAAFHFRRAHTSVIPVKPTTAIVTGGPFALTRNPMYIGMTLLYIGATMWSNSPWPLPFLPVVLLAVQYYVIAREERYLEAKFGDEYRTYKSRVRRWL